jgi:hypothetical protein
VIPAFLNPSSQCSASFGEAHKEAQLRASMTGSKFFGAF